MPITPVRFSGGEFLTQGFSLWKVPQIEQKGAVVRRFEGLNTDASKRVRGTQLFDR
jgi:hypothetical protein